MPDAPVNGPENNCITEQVEQNHKVTPCCVIALALILFGEDYVGDVDEDLMLGLVI